MVSAASELDFDRLPPYQPRSFVPMDANLQDKEQVEGLFQKLLERDVNSQVALERWLLDRSELEAALDQTGDVLYIKMTCQTDNEKFVQDRKHFVENITPAVKPLEDQMNQKYLKLRENIELDTQRYEVYDRAIRTEREIFREENVALETQVALLSQDYQTVCGAMSVQFQGEEKTLPQMGKYLEETDRDLREAAWRAMLERRFQDRDRLDEIFDKMCDLRNQIARNAGFDNFRDFQFRAFHRFDYTPADCKQYHDVMERLGVPLLKKFRQKRQQQMKLEGLRPWDTAVDSLGRPPLKPFEHVDELISGVQQIFQNIDAELGGQFEDMAKAGLLDLASRKGKAPGGYQNTLTEARKPFIFMNAVGVDYDVTTLLHEGGHAFHALACAHDPLLDYRHGPMEFSEVASMSMEMLGSEHLSVFYSKEDHQRSFESHMEDVVEIMVWVANIDSFQHWIYEHPQHTRDELNDAWVAVHQRFGGGLLDWSGLEKYRRTAWHRQLHIFECPFYYIEYGIAQLGALQIWLNSQKDLGKSIDDYRHGLALGGSRPLPELFEAAGIRFDFSEKTIAPLLEAVEKRLTV